MQINSEYIRAEGRLVSGLHELAGSVIAQARIYQRDNPDSRILFREEVAVDIKLPLVGEGIPFGDFRGLQDQRILNLNLGNTGTLGRLLRRTPPRADIQPLYNVDTAVLELESSDSDGPPDRLSFSEIAFAEDQSGDIEVIKGKFPPWRVIQERKGLDQKRMQRARWRLNAPPILSGDPEVMFLRYPVESLTLFPGMRLRLEGDASDVSAFRSETVDVSHAAVWEACLEVLGEYGLKAVLPFQTADYKGPKLTAALFLDIQQRARGLEGVMRNINQGRTWGQFVRFYKEQLELLGFDKDTYSAMLSGRGRADLAENIRGLNSVGLLGLNDLGGLGDYLGSNRCPYLPVTAYDLPTPGSVGDIERRLREIPRVHVYIQDNGE